MEKTTPCWVKFLTPIVEVDEKYNETNLEYRCEIIRKRLKVYYKNDDRFDWQPITNLATAIFPLCLSCPHRQLEGYFTRAI